MSQIFKQILLSDKESPNKYKMVSSNDNIKKYPKLHVWKVIAL